MTALFFNATATTAIYTLSLHDALPIYAQAPDWAQGLFDGKIRLPVEGAMRDGTALDRVLRHEYTHALVQDRKSTRLNSSHRTISYAVFCLKKKKNNKKYRIMYVRHSYP